MAEERVTRKLAAILAADMVGYSRLMEKDEEGIIARQKAHRAELIDPKLAEHGGRIVKSAGDGLLVEFGSAVDAVKCSTEIQRAMVDREADFPEDRRIAYRVGINIGDIVIDGDDILGDGVNIAARLEALAAPGGICVSGTVHEHVAGKLDLAFDDMGEKKVKNIARPIRVLRWTNPTVAAAESHTWAERYDRNLEDVFAIQDEITQEIVAALEVKLTEGEQVRLWRRDAASPAAYEHFSIGRDAYMTFSRFGNAQAKSEFRKAIEINPDFSTAFAHLAFSYANDRTSVGILSGKRCWRRHAMRHKDRSRSTRITAQLIRSSGTLP